MVSQRLINYIKEDLKGHNKGEIKKILVEQGYPEELVDNAIMAAVEANEQEKETEIKEEEKRKIKKVEEERESRKEQLKVKSEQTKKKLGELKKKTIEKTKNNLKILIPILIIIIFVVSFIVFNDFFNDWFYNIKNEKSLVLDLSFDNYSINGNLTIVADNSKYGNDGILKGDAKLVDTEFGKAVKLNGSGYVEVNDSNSLDIGDEITIMAWIYHKGGSKQLIVGNGGGWKDNGYHIMFYKNKVRFELQDTERGEKSICDSTPINDNRRYYVVATWSTADNIMHIYIDNIETNTKTFTGPIGDSNASLGIGYGFYPTYEGSYFNGTIYQLKIYNRALSQSEISYLYNKGRK